MVTATFPTLETTRLILREISVDDWPHLAYLRSDEQVNTYTNRKLTHNKEEALSFIQHLQEDQKNEKMLYWAICPKETNRMIGSICLWHFSEDRSRAEVGCDLHPLHQGMGIMQEALSRILKFAFHELYIQEIEAYTHRNNKASRKLLKKNGFTLVEGKIDYDNLHNLVFHLKP